MNVKLYFKELRFNPKHHLGLGDIRLTVAQQEEILAEIDRLTAEKESISNYSFSLQRAIEYHVTGFKIPAEIAELCPDHAQMLDKELRED